MRFRPAARARSPGRCASAWLALLAFVLNALWPVVSLANPAGTQSWMEVCTSAGMQRVAIGDPAAAGDVPDALKVPQCPLCAASAGFDMAGPPALAFGIAFIRRSLPSALPGQPSPGIPVFLSAQPRAPPATA